MEPSVYLASVLHLRGVEEVLQRFEQKFLPLYARVLTGLSSCVARLEVP